MANAARSGRTSDSREAAKAHSLGFQSLETGWPKTNGEAPKERRRTVRRMVGRPCLRPYRALGVLGGPSNPGIEIPGCAPARLRRLFMCRAVENSIG